MVPRRLMWLRSLIGPLLGLLLVTGLFWAVDTYQASQQGRVARFASIDSLQVVLQSTSLVGVAALGMTLIIIAGGIDLSAAASMALASTVAAWSFRQGYPPVVGVSAALATGLLLGMINGVLVSGLKVVPFIVTLGTMTIYRGIGREIAGGTPIRAHGSVPEWLLNLQSPYPTPEWLLVAPGVWVMLLLAVAVAGLLHLSVFGRHVFALGSNEQTARLCGIDVRSTRIAVYTLAGFFVGVAGLFQFVKLYGEGDPNSLPGKELDVIAAVVIGGGSLSGGRGSVLGTLAGACLMEVIRHGCVILGVPTAYQQIIVGVIVIAAVTVDQARQRRLTG
jgi:ribose transport system permease protein